MLTICGCSVNIDLCLILRDNTKYASWMPNQKKKKKKGPRVFKTAKNGEKGLYNSKKEKEREEKADRIKFSDSCRPKTALKRSLSKISSKEGKPQKTAMFF